MYNDGISTKHFEILINILFLVQLKRVCERVGILALSIDIHNYVLNDFVSSLKRSYLFLGLFYTKKGQIGTSFLMAMLSVDMIRNFQQGTMTEKKQSRRELVR